MQGRIFKKYKYKYKMDKIIQSVKKFWNDRPCNIRHSKKEVGTIEYFEEVERRRYTVEPHILEFANFKDCNNKKILEIGCGIGTDTIMFAKNGGKVTAIDISEKSVEITKKRFEVYGKEADIIAGNAEDLSKYIEPQTFDLIYSFGVIHHTPNPSAIIDEIKKFCDSETLIKLMFYSKFSWKAIEFFIVHSWKFWFNYKKTIQYFAEAQLDCPIAEVYSLKELKNLFKEFDIIEIKKDYIFPYVIENYIKGEMKRKLIFRIMPNFVFRYMERKLGWHYLITLKKID
jgi:2-polyprenyl-3-methyl-5-hydroxy-6-metoxy-1,4-benzoquinol methylase